MRERRKMQGSFPSFSQAAFPVGTANTLHWEQSWQNKHSQKLAQLHKDTLTGQKTDNTCCTHQKVAFLDSQYLLLGSHQEDSGWVSKISFRSFHCSETLLHPLQCRLWLNSHNLALYMHYKSLYSHSSLSLFAMKELSSLRKGLLFCLILPVK